MSTVLIVDDVSFEANHLQAILGSDYSVQVASNADEAFSRLLDDRLPDIILLDVVMPQIDGFEICRTLKQTERTKDIPVIFITGRDDERDEAKGLEYGAVDYITKPFRPGIVRARVRTHIELKKRCDQLASLSSLDGLTGIANRRRFDEFLRMEWNRGLRERSSLSILILDIDHFKRYNDSFGHVAGDECIKAVAAGLSDVIHRSTDLIARYGGEEFGIVLPNTGITGIEFLSKMIIQAVERLNIPHPDSPVASHVTVSIGGASVEPSEDLSLTDFIQAADKALYQSKQGGRNRYTGVDLRQQAYLL